MVILAISLPLVLSYSQESADSLGEPKKAFENMKKIDRIKYNEQFTTIINQRRGELPADDLFYYPPPNYVADKIIVLKTRIDQSIDKYYVIQWSQEFGPGNSYMVYYENDPKNWLGGFRADQVVIPGNGYIYTSCRDGEAFEIRRKFKIEDNKLIEIQQPFYYVGLKTRTLKPIELYNDLNWGIKIADIPANYEIEVLLAADKGEIQKKTPFLIKTSFGLVGWADITVPYIEFDEIEGINKLD